MSRFPFCLAALAFCLCCGTPRAQMQWVTSGQWPVNAIIGPAAMDRGRDRFIALTNVGGGLGVSEFDGQNWAAASAPPLMSINPSLLCYDEGRQETVLFGSQRLLAQWETWTWNGEKWTQASTQIPTPGGIMSCTYHRGRGRVMAIAGVPNSTVPTELWEWDGSTWSIVPVGQPLPTGPRFGAVAYDESRDRLVTCCALSQNASGAVYLPYTWEWDAQSGWQIVDTSSPTRALAAIAYDEARRVVVVWAYLGSASTFECWERLGKGAWVRRPNTPEEIAHSIYDPFRRRILTTGRISGNLYSYQPVYPAGLTTFSPGCPGLSGTPTITQKAAYTGAWIGDTLQVTVEPVPTAFAGLFLGFSNTTYQGIPLPIDLGPIGMPNCSLHVAPEAFLLCTGTGTSCNGSLAVPDSNALRGAAVYLQAAVPAPTVNPSGLVLSDAVVATVGSR